MTQENWIPCAEPTVGDIIRWKEPLWAAPNKPRGKRDQIGEQILSGTITAEGEFIELVVRSAEKISSSNDEPLQVKTGDSIRRKPSSIAKGDCHKLQE